MVGNSMTACPCRTSLSVFVPSNLVCWTALLTSALDKFELFDPTCAPSRSSMSLSRLSAYSSAVPGATTRSIEKLAFEGQPLLLNNDDDDDDDDEEASCAISFDCARASDPGFAPSGFVVSSMDLLPPSWSFFLQPSTSRW
mmetsp:Transcript_7582/g.21488  ORF Transcript_7582/g.21488 Transcript_7582/m.21488 type:complete len:141 (-) Transcript_7582:621-1043(-)